MNCVNSVCKPCATAAVNSGLDFVSGWDQVTPLAAEVEQPLRVEAEQAVRGARIGEHPRHLRRRPAAGVLSWFA